MKRWEMVKKRKRREFMTKYMSTYPKIHTPPVPIKAEKATVRQRAKNIRVLDGVLYYTGPKRDAKKEGKQII